MAWKNKVEKEKENDVDVVRTLRLSAGDEMRKATHNLESLRAYVRTYVRMSGSVSFQKKRGGCYDWLADWLAGWIAIYLSAFRLL